MLFVPASWASQSISARRPPRIGWVGWRQEERCNAIANWQASSLPPFLLIQSITTASSRTVDDCQGRHVRAAISSIIVGGGLNIVAHGIVIQATAAPGVVVAPSSKRLVVARSWHAQASGGRATYIAWSHSSIRAATRSTSFIIATAAPAGPLVSVL